MAEAAARTLAELTPGRTEKYPRVEVVREPEPVSGSASRTQVTSSALRR